MRALPAFLLILALAGCGGAEESKPSYGRRGEIPSGNKQEGMERALPGGDFGAEQSLSGVWETRFEHSVFNGCWFSMTPEAVTAFRRLYPPESPDGPSNSRRYQIEIMGRRSVDTAGAPNRYGHLNGWPCEIRATQIISAQVLGPA